MLARTGLFEEAARKAPHKTEDQDEASEPNARTSPERIGKKPVLSFSSAFASRWANLKEKEQGEGNSQEERKRIDLHLSVSHDGDICTANVLADLVDADAPQIDAQRLKRTLQF